MRWIFGFFWFTAVLIAVAVVALLLLPAERLARIATDQLSSLTGREVRIEGDVGLSVWPVLGLRAEGLVVGAAPWAEGPLLRTDRAALGLDARSLLRGDIRVTHLDIEGPVVRLEQTADGRASWMIADAASAPQPAAPSAATEDTQLAVPRLFVIERLQVTDATVIFENEGDAPVRYDGIGLSLAWPEPAAPAEVDLTFRPGNAPVSVSATVEGFAGFLRGEVRALRAGLETPSGSVSFAGRGSITGELAGDLELRSDDTDGYLRALGLSPMELPPNLGGRIEVSTALTLTPDLRLSLRDVVAVAGTIRLAGAADLRLDGTPQVNAQFSAGLLDLSANGAPVPPARAGGNGSPAGAVPDGVATAAPGWSTVPIDAGGLAVFNGEIALDAEGIILDPFRLGRTRAVLRVENARMVVELRDAQAYGGSLTGQFVANNRDGLSVGGQVDAQGVEIQQLFADAVDLDRITGQAGLSLSFLGAGQSVDAIMKSLGGDGRIEIGQGTFQGINLDRLMRGDPVASGTTIFDSLSGTWTIASGVLANDDLLLQLQNYEARGVGVIGIGARTVDYTVTPVALRANSGQGLSLPILFQGPWSDVSIRPDVEAAFDLRIDEEVDRLSDEAKERIDSTIDEAVDRQIEESLGVTPQDGQSTEDAVKEELKNRLLRRLFD